MNMVNTEDFENESGELDPQAQSNADEQKMMAFLNQMNSMQQQQQTAQSNGSVPPIMEQKNTSSNVGMNIHPEKDVNYWDIEDLPTKYRLYPSGTKLVARPLKVLDVKKLTSINDENADAIVNDILRKCVRGIDIKELYSADKMYLLLWLRANSFRDNNYVVGYRCNKCEQESSYHFTIDQVNVDYLSDDYSDGKLITMGNGDEVAVKLLQIKDEISIASFGTKYGSIFANSGEEIDEELLSISFMIDTVNGDTLDDVKRYNYLLDMSPEDFSKLTTYLNDISVGVKAFMNVTCEKCGGESHVGITFHPDFFLPKLRA